MCVDGGEPLNTDAIIDKQLRNIISKLLLQLSTKSDVLIYKEEFLSDQAVQEIKKVFNARL